MDIGRRRDKNESGRNKNALGFYIKPANLHKGNIFYILLLVSSKRISLDKFLQR
jgi:hypothetical protein